MTCERKTKMRTPTFMTVFGAALAFMTSDADVFYGKDSGALN